MKLLSHLFASKHNFLKKFNAIHLFISNLSIRSKSSRKRSSSKLPPSRQTGGKKPGRSSLFESIRDIVGSEISSISGSPTAASKSGAVELREFIVDDCNSDVRRIAQESVAPEKASQEAGSNGPHYMFLASDDVSPIVHGITGIVRSAKDGLQMAEQLHESGLTFNTEIVEKVLKRCFKVGHLALRFFNWVRLQSGFRHTTCTYNVILYIAAEAKEASLVERLVMEMGEEGCAKDMKTHTILLSYYGKSNQIGKALLTFTQMKKEGYLPDKAAYEAILKGLVNTGNGELALEFYKEMVLHKIEVEVKLYKMLMNCLSMSGLTTEVRLFAKEMVSIAKLSEGDTYVHAMRSFCIAGRIQEARELLDELEKKNDENTSIAQEVYLQGLCRAGRMEEALQIFAGKELFSPLTRSSRTCGFLIDGFLRNGDVQKALEMFDEMRRLDLLPTVSSLTQIIQHLFRYDNYKCACRLYDEFRKSGVEPDIVATTAMVAGHVRHGHIYDAWETFELMKKKGIKPSLKAYSVFIKELCKASEPVEAFKLLEEMVAYGMNASVDILGLVISCLSRKGDLEKAKKVEQMRKEKFKLYAVGTELMEQEHQPSQIRRAPLIVDSSSIEVDTDQDNDRDLEEVCKILASETDWKSMQAALEGFSMSQFRPKLVELALRRSQRHGYAALNFFSWLGGCNGYEHTAETYNMAIKIAGSGKDFRHMRNLYKEMRRRFPPTPNTWTIMISQYGQAGLTKMALEAFKDMKKDGLTPDGSTYKHLIIYLCGRKGRILNEAIRLFDKMIRAGHLPDREVVSIFLTSLCESRKFEDAKTAVQTLCRRGFVTQLGYSLLLRSVCRAGRVEQALELAKDIGKSSFEMDGSTYGSFFHAFLRKGQIKEAMDMLHEMESRGFTRNTHILTSLLVYYGKEKQICKAIEVFGWIKEPTVVTLSAMIRGYVNVGMVSEAWNVFREMRTRGPSPDFETFSMFMSCLCKAGRSEEGLQLIKEMMEIGIVPSAVNFRTVVFGLYREGKQELARSILETKWALNRRRRLWI